MSFPETTALGLDLDPARAAQMRVCRRGDGLMPACRSLP